MCPFAGVVFGWWQVLTVCISVSGWWWWCFGKKGRGVGIVGRESTRFAFDGVKEGTYQVGIVQDAILLFK